MRDLRIVFMGTPAFAVTILSSILQQKYNVVGVVTAPDKPAGRGRKINESAVKKFAIEKNLPVLQPTNLKSEAFIKELIGLKPNVQVVVAFRMLPKLVWQLPSLGTFNLHASLLPQYRGAAPIHWAIINGEEKTGTTTFFIDEKIDTGAMILQNEVMIQDDETVGSLHDKLMNKGADLVLDTLRLIQQAKIETTLQPQNEILKEAPKLNRENTKIDWSDSLNNIYNKIRGLDPFPAAWTTLVQGDKEEPLKIFGVQKEIANHNHTTGKIIVSKKEFKIAVQDGYINCLELQLPGKRKMKVTDLLNGLQFTADAYVR
ncbi:methionyl-tRNA formyltransferase [Gangjinia marincola]|uniref:Methionyl-tRNA formyltransferase n=1 Tax=Gangjinia marincola TaxID=578463 RepID=A0ABP3XRE6_9FLAO